MSNQIQANVDLKIGANEIQFISPNTNISDDGANFRITRSASPVTISVGGTFDYEFGGGESNWNDNDLINMGILQFANPDNRIFQSGGGSELKIQGDTTIELGLSSTPTTLFSFGANTFNWDSAIDTVPDLTISRTQSGAVSTGDIFRQFFRGQDDNFLSVLYAQIAVRQNVTTPLAGDGAIAFLARRNGSLLPFVTLDGETSKLALEVGIGITFPSNTGFSELVLESSGDTDNNLLFEGNVVKTIANNNQRDLPADVIISNTSTAILFGLDVASRVNRPGGLELFIYNLQVQGNVENRQFDIEMIIGGVEQPTFRMNVPTSNRVINIPFSTIIPTNGLTVQIRIINNLGNTTQLTFQGNPTSSTNNITRLLTMEIA